jgi:HlyD family secretion protein
MESNIEINKSGAGQSPWALLVSYRWFLVVAFAVVLFAGWQVARMVFGPAVVVEQIKRGNRVWSKYE